MLYICIMTYTIETKKNEPNDTVYYIVSFEISLTYDEGPVPPDMEKWWKTSYSYDTLTKGLLHYGNMLPFDKIDDFEKDLSDLDFNFRNYLWKDNGWAPMKEAETRGKQHRTHLIKMIEGFCAKWDLTYSLD